MVNVTTLIWLVVASGVKLSPLVDTVSCATEPMTETVEVVSGKREYLN